MGAKRLTVGRQRRTQGLGILSVRQLGMEGEGERSKTLRGWIISRKISRKPPGFLGSFGALLLGAGAP